MIKGSFQEEDIKIVNIYAPNIEAPQFTRQMLTAIKGKLTVTQLEQENLTLRLHQWIDHQDRKLIRKHKL